MLDICVKHRREGSRGGRVKIAHLLSQQAEKEALSIDARNFFADKAPQRVGQISKNQVVNGDTHKDSSDDPCIVANVIWSLRVKNVEQLAKNDGLRKS